MVNPELWRSREVGGNLPSHIDSSILPSKRQCNFYLIILKGGQSESITGDWEGGRDNLGNKGIYQAMKLMGCRLYLPIRLKHVQDNFPEKF